MPDNSGEYQVNIRHSYREIDVHVKLMRDSLKNQAVKFLPFSILKYVPFISSPRPSTIYIRPNKKNYVFYVPARTDFRRRTDFFIIY